MSHCNTILSQLKKFVPEHSFAYLVEKYRGDHRVKHFTCNSQLTTLLYAQATQKDSLRDIEVGLGTHGAKLYHLGINKVSRSTLADANRRVSYELYQQLFYKILERCHQWSPRHKFRFKKNLYSLDATTIDLCLSCFPWARFRTTKGAIKIHALLNHAGHIPDFIDITDGKTHEITLAKANIVIPPDSIVVMDMGYLDYGWLYRIHKNKAFFVIRKKRRSRYVYTGQHQPITQSNILLDRRIRLKGFYTAKDYPEELRLVRYRDPDTGDVYDYLTNAFHLQPMTIANIYKARWDIELFFKWIKQNLKIKTFLGTSKNAVMTQIWVAMIYYLLLAYVKFQTKYKPSLLNLARIIRETLMERIDLIDLLRINPNARIRANPTLAPVQLSLF